MQQDLNQSKYLRNAFHEKDPLPKNGNTSATHHIPTDMPTNLHISFPSNSAFLCTRIMHITIRWSWSKE
jgi:hypothetical protein